MREAVKSTCSDIALSIDTHHIIIIQASLFFDSLICKCIDLYPDWSTLGEVEKLEKASVLTA